MAATMTNGSFQNAQGLEIFTQVHTHNAPPRHAS
jgi:hypothetical protein